MIESRWWIFILLLIVTAAVILCIFNAITYNKIANENITVGDVTPDGARALMAFNVIILIFLFPLWIWYVYKLIVNDPEKRKVMLQPYKDYTSDKYGKFKDYTSDKYNGMKTAVTPSRWGRSSPRRDLDNGIELTTKTRNSNLFL